MEQRRQTISKKMQTTLTIPDEIFGAAERLAEKMQIPRDRLYALALAEFIARHDGEWTTNAMNRVADSLNEPPDSFICEAVRQAGKRIEWIPVVEP